MAAGETMVNEAVNSTYPPVPRDALKDVTVQLSYLANDPLYQTVKPKQVVPGFMDKERKSNIRLEDGELETIHDIRASADDFTLDGNGFRYVKASTGFKDWASQAQIGEVYLPEMEKLLRQEIDDADEIIFFDARIRTSGPEGTRVEGLSYNPFAKQVHVDQTEPSILTKVRNLTEMKADYLLKGRTRIVNIWRPIRHPVFDCALAIADGGKLLPADVIECDRTRLDTGEFWDTMGVVQYRKGYDWYYMSEQDEEDVLLFKNYDSDGSVPARHCLHTAFDLPPEMIPVGAPTRESIEVRALVFTYPDGHHPTGVRGAPRPAEISQTLATALQQGCLPRIDHGDGIVDMLRAQLEQAKSATSAVLALRHREREHAKEIQEHLVSDRDHARAEVSALQQRLDRLHLQRERQNPVMTAETLRRNASAQEQVVVLETENERLKKLLSYRLNDESEALAISRGMYGSDPERIILRQQLQAAKAEAAGWETEARGRANRCVSEKWQADVDEAVRRERAKDEFVIQDLRQQMKGVLTLLAERDECLLLSDI